MKQIIFYSLLLLLSGKLQSQPTAIHWFGDNQDRSGILIRQTYDGGFILVGQAWNTTNPIQTVWLIKTDSNGDSLWSKIIALDTLWVTDIIETPDSGFALTGEQGGSTCLVKTDSLGDLEWVQHYSIGTIANGVVFTSTGYYAIVGSYEYGPGPICCYPFLIRTDINGYQIPALSYNGFGSNGRAYAIVESADSNLIVSWASINGPPQPKLIKVKYNSNSTIWSKSFSLSCECSLTKTSNEEYLLAGHDYNGQGGAIIKTDSSGIQTWMKFIADYHYTYNYPEEANGSGYIAAGTLSNDLLLVKFDLNGDTMWIRVYGDTAVDYGSRVVYTPDNRIAAIGTTKSYGSNGLKNILLVIADSSGQVLSVNNIVPPSDNIQCYPNPSSTYIDLDIPLSNQNVNIKVFDVCMRKVNADVERINFRKFRINVSHLTHGIYFFNCTVSDKNYFKKFIVE